MDHFWTAFLTKINYSSIFWVRVNKSLIEEFPKTVKLRTVVIKVRLTLETPPQSKFSAQTCIACSNVS